MSPTAVRWLFGDQLGPHFTEDHRGSVLMVESKAVFRRRRFHRAKAQLVLSAMRHRAAELGDRVTYVRAEEYAGAVREHVADDPVEVVHPTSYAALGLVERLGKEMDLTVLDPRGFATGRGDFEALGRRSWPGAVVDGGLLPRGAAARTAYCSTVPSRPGVAGTTTTTTASHPRRALTRSAYPGRRGPRRTTSTPRCAQDLDRGSAKARSPSSAGTGRGGSPPLVGRLWPHSTSSSANGCPASVRTRTRCSREIPGWRTRWSRAPLNLGLLDPLEVVRRAESAYLAGEAPIASVEGFVRQVLGWRDYVWHLYWHFPESYRRSNAVGRDRADAASGSPISTARPPMRAASPTP